MALRLSDKRAILWIGGIILTTNTLLFFILPAEKISKTPTPPTVSAKTNATPKTENVTSDAQSTLPLFYFDPNTADSATFVALGLRPRVAKAICNYRRAGGIFHSPNDFSRIYTLKDSDFQRLRPYIKIAQSFSISKQRLSPTVQHPEPLQDKPVYRTQTTMSYKLHQGETISLATADSLSLLRIPGIGPYYAHKIIRYRNRLGGFVSLAQLKEIQGLPDDITQWFSLQTITISQLKINELTFGQLLRHPYLNYEQVQAILNYRKIYGSIHSLNDLRNYTSFTPQDFERIQPYIDFSE